jgi:spore photoproduct lyase
VVGLIPFVPKRVYFEPEALDYPVGRRLRETFTAMGIPVLITTSHNRVTGIPGKTPREQYVQAKLSLVVGVRRTLTFASCRPSAHYQLPLVTSCPGFCEYCYLQTTLGPKPINRVYVNIEEILDRAGKYIAERAPEVTIFEGAATSDPVPTEHFTGALRAAIEYFARQESGRFRFVTKFSAIDSILDAEHNGRTEVRYSLNTARIIGTYERGTTSKEERIRAATRTAAAGYPLGFLIAPIFIYPNWRTEYAKLLDDLAEALPAVLSPRFELITHRFTTRAKRSIERVYPDSTLPLDEAERQFKYGQFGYGKYVYPQEQMAEIKDFFTDAIAARFPKGEIAYLV